MNQSEERIEKKKEERKEKRRKFVQAILIVIFIILLILLGLKGCSSDSDVVPDGVKNFFNVGIDQGATEGGVEGRTKEEIQEELNKSVQASMITVSMNTTPIFEDGNSEGRLLIVNETKNIYPQIVQIFLREEKVQADGTKTYVDGQMIYQSGMIPVGSKIEEAKLSVDLDKGDYKCIAYFNAVTEEGEYIGKAAANITIKVLN